MITTLLAIGVAIALLIVAQVLFDKNKALEKRIALLEKKLPESAQSVSLNQVKIDIPVLETQKEESEYSFEKHLQERVPERESKSNPVYTKVKAFLLGGNVIAKIGILILFFGVAFLLKFAAAHFSLPITYRLSGVFLAGIAMVAIGCKLARTRKNYANTLQGGGIGLMYLTVYAAFQLYHVLPPLPAFLLLLGIVIVSGALAIFYDAKSLAIFGILGGFMAPLLISTGSSDYILLFSYYLLLNIAIAGTSWFKAWPELNLIGFVFTFIISALWGYQSYQGDYFYTTELFLAIFFLFYVLLTLLLMIKQPSQQKSMIYNILLFATPTIVLALQIGLVKGIPYGVAWSTFALFVFYALLASLIHLFKSTELSDVRDIFVALSLLFGTITVPLTLANIQAAATWALESIVVLWFGMRQKNLLMRIGAGWVLLASNILCIWNSTDAPNDSFISEFYLSGMFIAIANFICAYLFYSIPNRKNDEFNFAKLFFILGSVGWYFINLFQIWLHVVYADRYFISLLFIASSSLLAWLSSEFLNWSWLRRFALVLLPAMIVISMLSHPSFIQTYGILLAWLYGFAVLYFLLYRHEHFPASYLSRLHFISFIYLVWFLADQMGLFVKHYHMLAITWQYIAWGVIPALAIYFTCYGKSLLAWPLKYYETAYQKQGNFILILFLTCWILKTNTLPGDFNILPYIPLLNPLDIAIALAFSSFVVWYPCGREWLDKQFDARSYPFVLALISLFIFIWLNVIVFRTIHQWMLVPFNPIALWNSTAAQMCLSILWAVLALITTYVASKYYLRELWFLGLALILILIAKLFLIDLSATNTLARIITFIGVGILFLINGYISPLPPKEK